MHQTRSKYLNLVESSANEPASNGDWPPLMRQWASYQIRKIAGCACAGNAGNVFPHRWFQREPLVSDPGMHHGTCLTHLPWCMSGSLTCGDGENVPGIPGACAPAILRIRYEAHAGMAIVIHCTVWIGWCLMCSGKCWSNTLNWDVCRQNYRMIYTCMGQCSRHVNMA